MQKYIVFAQDYRLWFCNNLWKSAMCKACFLLSLILVHLFFTPHVLVSLSVLAMSGIKNVEVQYSPQGNWHWTSKQEGEGILVDTLELDWMNVFCRCCLYAQPFESIRAWTFALFELAILSDLAYQLIEFFIFLNVEYIQNT